MKLAFCFKREFFVFIVLFIFHFDMNSQVVKGLITSNNQVVPFANIVIEKRNLVVSANKNGEYKIENIKLGETNISFSALGMIQKKVNINIEEGINILDVDLLSSVYNLDQVVVTGTKTFKRKTDSPVIVNVIDSKKLIGVNACNIAEGLKTFKGIKRRYEKHINTEKLVYIDDYAHHPEEVSTTIDATKELYPLRKLIVVFQPHLYTFQHRHTCQF